MTVGGLAGMALSWMSEEMEANNEPSEKEGQDACCFQQSSVLIVMGDVVEERSSSFEDAMEEVSSCW